MYDMLESYLEVPVTTVFLSIGSVFLLLCITIKLCKIVRRLFPVMVNCWFCNADTRVKYDAANSWHCSQCGQYNGFTADGGYNRWIPAHHYEYLNWAGGGGGRPKKLHSMGNTNPLCPTCNNNQVQKVAQLAAFEPMQESRHDEEIQHFHWCAKSTGLKMTTFRALPRAQLERWYSLCPKCETAVERTLHIQQKALFGDRIPTVTRKAPTRKNQLPHSATYPIVTRIVVAMTILSLVLLTATSSLRFLLLCDLCKPYTPASLQIYYEQCAPYLTPFRSPFVISGLVSLGEFLPDWCRSYLPVLTLFDSHHVEALCRFLSSPDAATLLIIMLGSVSQTATLWRRRTLADLFCLIAWSLLVPITQLHECDGQDIQVASVKMIASFAVFAIGVASLPLGGSKRTAAGGLQNLGTNITPAREPVQVPCPLLYRTSESQPVIEGRPSYGHADLTNSGLPDTVDLGLSRLRIGARRACGISHSQTRSYGSRIPAGLFPRSTVLAPPRLNVDKMVAEQDGGASPLTRCSSQSSGYVSRPPSDLGDYDDPLYPPVNTSYFTPYPTYPPAVPSLYTYNSPQLAYYHFAGTQYARFSPTTPPLFDPSISSPPVLQNHPTNPHPVIQTFSFLCLTVSNVVLLWIVCYKEFFKS